MRNILLVIFILLFVGCSSKDATKSTSQTIIYDDNPGYNTYYINEKRNLENTKDNAIDKVKDMPSIQPIPRNRPSLR